MASPLITGATLVAFWPDASSRPIETTEAVTAAASAIVRRDLPNIDADIASGAVDSSLVGLVVSAMVQRKLTDAVRVEQVSQAMFQYDTAWLASGIFMTEDEKELLTPAPEPEAGSRYGAIRPRLGLAP